MTRAAIPSVLVPLTLTDSMFAAGTTIAEPASGETAWVSAGSYTAGTLRTRSTTHRIYRAITTHSGISTLPENDPLNWQDYAPTNRWAPFDPYISTPATATTSLTYVLTPGFINAVALYGLVGNTLAVTYKDTTGGTICYSNSISLVGPYADEWDYCFGPSRQRDRVVISGLMPYPNCELTLTLTGDIGATVEMGMLALGDLRPLVLGDWGGTQYGAEATPKTYSYIKTADDGTVSIRRRHAGTDMSIEVILPQADADYALSTIQETLDVPAAWIGATADGYASFNVFGLGSGTRRAVGPVHETISIQVKGMI